VLVAGHVAVGVVRVIRVVVTGHTVVTGLRVMCVVAAHVVLGVLGVELGRDRHGLTDGDNRGADLNLEAGSLHLVVRMGTGNGAAATAASRTAARTRPSARERTCNM